MPITTIVFRAFTLTVLAAPLLSIAQQAKPTQAKPDCAALIVSTPLLKESDFMGKRLCCTKPQRRGDRLGA